MNLDCHTWTGAALIVMPFDIKLLIHWVFLCTVLFIKRFTMNLIFLQVAVELRPNMNTRFMGSKAKIWFFVNILKIGHEAEKAANDKIIKAVTDFIMAQKFPGLEDDG